MAETVRSCEGSEWDRWLWEEELSCGASCVGEVKYFTKYEVQYGQSQPRAKLCSWQQYLQRTTEARSAFDVHVNHYIILLDLC